ncbi:MAG: hypothetical protein EOO25_07055 [Comamonadaceae bacterium]|nr:MAG: hypothetical protein EOO25_07055 [Comamonadaceae bacterium]
MSMLTLYRRRWGLFYLPVLALAALAVVAAARFWFPLPPRQVVLAAGVPQGGYAQMAERYRDELGERGIAVDITATEAGNLGPLQRLANPADPAQAGFANGLQAERGPEAPVAALAVIGKQPVWVFTHHTTLSGLAMLRGLKIAAGPPGSVGRQVATMLLAQAQIQPGEVQWDDAHQGMAAANELLERRVDAMVSIGSAEAPTVRLLTRAPGIAIMGVERANALARREPRLHPLVLPQGVIELRGDIPPRDMTLLYANTHLLVRETMHPALQRAFLDAATEIHALPSFLQRQSEYPEFQSDFPLSPVVQRYTSGERPWLELLLPYWWAQLATLLLYGVLPVLALTLLALLWIPQFFSLRVNALLSHYYGELKFIENDLHNLAAENPMGLRAALAKLDAMERELASLHLPERFADRWYTLREHLAAARDLLLRLRAR